MRAEGYFLLWVFGAGPGVEEAGRKCCWITLSGWFSGMQAPHYCTLQSIFLNLGLSLGGLQAVRSFVA